MSGLVYLCDYGTESESDDEIDENLSEIKKPNRSKLPVPDLSHIPTVKTDQHVDNPDHHQGRVRSFPHVRGNWATFVYINYPDEQSLLILAKKLKKLLSNVTSQCHISDDFHLSLSKTVTLNYHTISPFIQSLKECLNAIDRFYLGLNSVEILCNEEKTRTFIVLKVDYCSNKNLSTIVEKVDYILGEFKLDKFYKEPSFHISLLWIEGDQRSQLEPCLEHMNNIVSQEVGKTLVSILIDKVNCKSGNKFFQYSLN